MLAGGKLVFGDSGVGFSDDLTRDFVALELTGLDDVRWQFTDVDDAAGKLGLADDTFASGSVGQLGLLVDVLTTGVGLVGLAMGGDGVTALVDDGVTRWVSKASGLVLTDGARVLDNVDGSSWVIVLA